MRNLEAGVSNFASFLTEDRTQEPLFWGEFGFTFWCDLSDEDITRANFGTDADNSTIIEVGEDVVGEIRDVTRDLFWSELGVTSVDLVDVNVNRRQHIVFHKPLRQDDGVLEVIALPRHECDEEVLSESEFTTVG